MPVPVLLSCSAFYRSFKNTPHQFRHIPSKHFCRHRYQAVVCHTRHRVDLNQPGAMRCIEEKIDASPSRRSHRIKCLLCQFLKLKLLIQRQAARAVIASTVSLVLCLVVIKLARCFQPDQWQRSIADYGCRILCPLNRALGQYLVVILICIPPCLFRSTSRTTLVIPMLEPSCTGLRIIGKPS